LAQKTDHEPSHMEIAEFLDQPVSEVRRMLNLKEPIQSVDISCGDDANTPLVEMLPDLHAADPMQGIQEEEVHDGVEHWLTQLDDRHCQVIERRFGLHGYRRSTLKELADELKVSRERVRQIQTESLDQLREVVDEEGFAVEALM